MTPKLRRILIGSVIALVIAAVPIAFLDYYLPHHAIVRIIGTDTRRPLGGSKNSPSPVLHDTFYINAEDVETQKPRVFRNEDTGWGFPFYFKFNSADLQTVAQSIASEHGTALLTYYGWRIQIFSVVPNVTNIKRAGPNDELPFPWFNVALFAVLLGAGLWLYFWIRGLRTQHR
jgi:Protein of unknown function (DUF1523)